MQDGTQIWVTVCVKNMHWYANQKLTKSGKNGTYRSAWVFGDKQYRRSKNENIYFETAWPKQYLKDIFKFEHLEKYSSK